MSKEAFERLEELFPEIVKLMPKDDFDSHEFTLILAQKYQKLYVQLLYMYKENNQPFQSVHAEIAHRLRKRVDLVEYVCDHSSINIFGRKNECAVWRKVK